MGKEKRGCECGQDRTQDCNNLLLVRAKGIRRTCGKNSMPQQRWEALYFCADCFLRERGSEEKQGPRLSPALGGKPDAPRSQNFITTEIK